MTATTTVRGVSAVQYHAIYGPVLDLTPQQLFDIYVQRFREKGIDLPQNDVDRLCPLIPEESPQFLLIPPRPAPLDLSGLMALIEVDGKTGGNSLDAQRLTDVVNTPTTAHLLLDVEDGRGRLNTKPSVSRQNIKTVNRTPYTTWYGLVHGIVFPCVLQDHYLDLVGSRHESVNVPGLCLNVSKVPMLVYDWSDHDTLAWGAPSAGSVVGA